MGLLGQAKGLTISLAVLIHECDGLTDGRTDGHLTMTSTVLCTALHNYYCRFSDKNCNSIILYAYQITVIKLPCVLSTCGLWTEMPSKCDASDVLSISACADRPRDTTLASLKSLGDRLSDDGVPMYFTVVVALKNYSKHWIMQNLIICR